MRPHRTKPFAPSSPPPCTPNPLLAGKGDEAPGQPAQDLVFVVRQKPHPVFTREGDDLVTTQRISLRWGGQLPRRVGHLRVWVAHFPRWAGQLFCLPPCYCMFPAAGLWACCAHCILGRLQLWCVQP
jgi:hypothetical protein